MLTERKHFRVILNANTILAPGIQGLLIQSIPKGFTAHKLVTGAG
jgi:hypothetical protein